MAVSATKDFWIHPNALTITLNYFGDPQLIQTSMLAGSVILAYNKNYIGYDAAHNYREWKLQAFPTQLNDTCAYYVHAELSRDGDTAMIIYSPVKRDIEGRSFIDGAWDSTTSSASWFIYLGEISASVDADGATVERVWTDGLYTGTLATDQQRLEDAQGDWALMFQLNSATGLIDFLRTVSSATFNALTVAKNFIFGGHTFTSVASTAESGDEKKRNDVTLPTTGYVQKEIEALDEHFLIKDGNESQEVGGDVSFGGDVSVVGDNSVRGAQSIREGQTVGGNQAVGRDQSVGGNQTVDGTVRISSNRNLGSLALVIGDYIEQGDIVQGAAVDKDGVASFARVKTPSMQVYELVYNRKTAVQGEFVFSDGDTIESVTYICDDGTEWTNGQVEDGLFSPYASDGTTQNFRYIRLELSVPYDGYTTTMKEFDILYSNINNIGASGESATTGKCFMRVLKTADGEEIAGVKGVSDDGTVLNVILYPHADTPSGHNMLPTPHMTITRHGNEVNPSRQDLFLISSEDGRIAQLTGIDSPIIKHDSSYGIVLGRLPYNLIEYIRQAGYAYVKEDQPYLYARGAVIQDLIRIDYKGKVIKTENYRGMWSQSIANGEIEGEDKYASTDTMYDTVTHDGSLWRCNKNETTEEPRGGITDWLLLIAKGDDGKDGLTTNPNLIKNSNFDMNDGDGTVTNWDSMTTDSIKIGEYNGYNVHIHTKGGNKQVLKYTLIKGQTYTLSCMMKRHVIDGVAQDITSAGFIFGIPCVKDDAGNDVKQWTKISGDFSATSNFSDRTDVFLPSASVITTEWSKKYITFKMNETVQMNYLMIYLKSGAYEISQIKLEVGDQATPYQKAQEDLGVTIVSTSVKYAKHTSGTDKPTTWSDTMPTDTDGYYLWTWTRVEYSTGNITDSYSVSRMGIDGRGIKSVITKYCQKENTDVSPEKFNESDWGEFPSTLKDGWWLYSRTITTYSDDSTSKSYNVTQNGQGSYYAGLQEYYAASNNSSTAPTGYPTEDIYASGADMPITGDWSKVRPTLTDAKPYLWNFSVSFDSKGNRYVVAPVCIGNFAKGITSIVETYAISASSTADKGSYPSDITSWTDEQQNATPTESKPYQWNKTETTYNDESKQIIYHVSAVKGADGIDGKDGLTAQPNLLQNSNFDIYEDGALKYVEVSKGQVIAGGYDGFYNSYKTGTSASGVLTYAFPFSIKKDTPYTFSCQTKCTHSSTSAYLYGVILELGSGFSKKVSIYNKNIYGNSSSASWDDEYAIYFNAYSEFTEQSFTFKYTPADGDPDSISGAKLRFYRWQSSVDAEYAILKIEEGENVTPYQKNQDDLKGKDGADAGNTYELIPNPSVIYVRKDKTMTASKITMAVGETTPHGFVKINSKDVLVTRNLSVEYAIDGGTRKSLDNFLTGVSLSYGQEQVVFYLKNTSGEDVTEKVVQLVYEGENGADGKDGLTAKANMLANTNFDLLESDGETLQTWKYYDSSVGTIVPVRKSDLVIEGVGLGFNAVYKTTSSATIFLQSKQVVNLQPNVVYTLSCYSKFDGESPNSSSNSNLNAYGYGIILAGTAAAKITYKSSSKVSNTNFGSSGANSEIYFGVNWGNKTDWVRHSVTFSVTEAIPSTNLRFHIWAANKDAGNTFYYSQPKLEVGSEATPYLKSQEDLAGASAITTHSEPSVIGLLVDAEEQTLINNKEHKVSVYAATPFGNLSTDSYTITIPSVTNITFGDPSVKDGKYSFTVKIKDGITRNAIPEYFIVNFTRKDGSTLGSHSVSITTAERGFVGKNGSSGAMILPYGNWSEESGYAMMRKGDDIIGKPLVFYKAPNASEGKNYVLNKDVPAGNPDRIQVTNDEYWTPVEEFKYIFTEALLANYAKLGGPDGGVFFKRYLFSQYGHNDTYYVNNVEGDDPIFDENDNLTGAFIPKLHLDFKAGLANLSCLCEPFYTLPVKTGSDGYIEAILTPAILLIEPSKGFNIKIPYIPIPKHECKMPLLVLPQFKENDSWMRNGAHITIMYEHGGSSWGAEVEGALDPQDPKRMFAIVSVDFPAPVGLGDYNPGLCYNSFAWDSNYIMCRGRRAKYLILAPGATVKLRAVQVGGYMHWNVENEGSIIEEKVDVYNIKSNRPSAAYPNNKETSITPTKCVRNKFYGADYSDIVNLMTEYYGVITRGVFLYAGPKGYCPKNIIFGHYYSPNPDFAYDMDIANYTPNNAGFSGFTYRMLYTNEISTKFVNLSDEQGGPLLS